MPNILFSMWVKNVNKLRLNGGVISDYISTINQINNYNRTTKWVQTQFIQPALLHKSTNIYTYLNRKFNLLNKSFTYYPQHLLMRLVKEI